MGTSHSSSTKTHPQQPSAALWVLMSGRGVNRWSESAWELPLASYRWRRHLWATHGCFPELFLVGLKWDFLPVSPPLAVLQMWQEYDGSSESCKLYLSKYFTKFSFYWIGSPKKAQTHYPAWLKAAVLCSLSSRPRPNGGCSIVKPLFHPVTIHEQHLI